MRTLLLIATIAIGIFFPFTHGYSFLIQYLLMIMLFFSFLKMEIRREHLDKSHLIILMVNLIVPLGLYFAISPFNLQLSQVVFITAIAPTAIASPIIVNLLKGKIEYTVISILITNFVIAFLLPFLLPFVLRQSAEISILDVLLPVAKVFLIPFFLAILIKNFLPGWRDILSGFNKYVFYVLVLNINLGTAKASHYIREEMGFGDVIIWQIAIASLLLCILFFFLGKRVVPASLQTEGKQALGQKNNGFTLWVALTFMNPLAVLGPVFYILFQNFYISWLLYRKKE